MTRVIIQPEKIVEIDFCEQCKEFRRERFFGIAPAYCAKEGRLLKGVQPGGAYIIPRWCNLKSKGEFRNKNWPYKEYIITNNQLADLEETGSWNVVRAIAKEIRSVQEVKSQEAKRS